MNVGFVGCGKLGLMVALTIESRGHSVKGYDVSPDPARYLSEKKIPFQEEHSDELLQNTKMEMVSLPALCDWADILFIAVQTPHAPQFEGSTPLPEERADFDYSYLKQAVTDVCANLKRPTPCVIISTCLPGTIDREIQPLIDEDFWLVYSPQFIAMGTVYEDFLNPEFWLIGGDDIYGVAQVRNFYCTLTQAFIPFVRTDIKTAEGIKVFYNTFITTKTVLANLYGEMSERLGMNVDDIYRAISLSTRRLLSPKYLKAGMGDGGGCHPRDNIALSWLAGKIGLSSDFFGALMEARECHCEWLAELIEQYRPWGTRVCILGRAFKPETNIESGSPALLLSSILAARGVWHICTEEIPREYDDVYVIATQHARYATHKFPKESTVIDPFRYIPDQEGVKVIRIGEGRTSAVPQFASCSAPTS